MHTDVMSDEVAKFFEEANVLQWRKNRDYHPDRVAMLEIMQTAFETGVTVEQDLWGRIRKQMSALRRFVIDGHVESEPPRQRMIDVAVYMGMMAFWAEHRISCLRDAYEFIHRSRSCETYKGVRGVNTCLTHGLPTGEACDRCQFLIWVGNACQNETIQA